MSYFPIIKILGIEYTIIERQPFHIEDYDMGMSDSIRNEIIIRSGMNQDTKESTILHEVIHILSDKMGLSLEENTINCLESGLYSVGYRLKEKL